MNNFNIKPHILFLFSDTGGGHRSATEAIIEAMHLEFDGLMTHQMVDIFKEIAPRPLNRMPSWYPYMVRLPEVWGLGYRISDGPHRANLLVHSYLPYVSLALRDVARRYPSDMIVSLHPLANVPFLRAMGPLRPPFVTVVTDLVTTHALWYYQGVDLCLVPTEEARRRALRCKLRPEQVKVVGLPVADRFCQPVGDRSALRERLGWPQDRPVVVLVGGGEGMGPLEKTALAIAEANLPLALVVICGRNEALKARLEAHQWPMPAFIYGFVREMPDFMQAADILVTKAGPGTVTEALNAGLPMILYSRLPGQEDGNVSYVTSTGVGVWAPQTEDIVAVLRTWIMEPEKREQAAAACRSHARPQAARNIAHILAGMVGVEAGHKQVSTHPNGLQDGIS
ncbi:MAG TPA: glycosyltransferase [Anaerolineales bacterium]|nr:glycosyltransferase [Anaerolineales bacterium]